MLLIMISIYRSSATGTVKFDGVTVDRDFGDKILVRNRKMLLQTLCDIIPALLKVMVHKGYRGSEFLRK